MNADIASKTDAPTFCNRPAPAMPEFRWSKSSSEEMLLKEVQPRLKSGIASSVPQVGADDPEELLQDGMVMALRVLQSAERAGKKVSAGKVSYYTLKALRQGRRSTGCHKTDPLHPATQICGRCRVHSLDERLPNEQTAEEAATLADVLASTQDDPATKAARRLDWNQVIEDLDEVAEAILVALVSGHDLTLLVPLLKRSRSALQTDKQALAKLIRERLGEDILHRIQERPSWQINIAVIRERSTSRRERQSK